MTVDCKLYFKNFPSLTLQIPIACFDMSGVAKNRLVLKAVGGADAVETDGAADVSIQFKAL